MDKRSATHQPPLPKHPLRPQTAEPPPKPKPNGKSFFGSFFSKKELLPLLPLA
jgi:hypothetical protein